MRILFTALGTRPHLYPLVPLAWAFRAAGHEVRLASTPMWAKEMAYTGLPTVTVGGSPRVSKQERDELGDMVFARQPPWPTNWAAEIHRLDGEKLAYLEKVGRYLIAAAVAMVDDLVAFARDWAPDAVVHDSFSYAGPVAAAVLGVPAISHHCGPESAQRLEFVQPGREPLPEYTALFERFGVEVRPEPSSIVDPTPPSMRIVTPPGLLDMRYLPYNGPGILPDGLMGNRPRPRVCVTWGHTLSTAVGASGARPFHAAIDALTVLGMDCVVAAPAAEIERLGRLPDSARAFASVPLHLVLPYCDAIVHQAGDGTALTASAAAIPQLCIAGSPEADMCAGRIAAAGAGIYLRYPELRDAPDSPIVIRHALQTLLSDPRFADGAGQLRDEIESQPTPAEVAARLAAYVSDGVPVGG